jgi:hypothetical protein
LIVRYHFLENTFDVVTAFRADGSWVIERDGTRQSIPSAQETTGAQHAR